MQGRVRGGRAQGSARLRPPYERVGAGINTRRTRCAAARHCGLMARRECRDGNQPNTQTNLRRVLHEPLTSILITALGACVVMPRVSPPRRRPPRTAGAPVVTVRYTDLNLATEAGTGALYARLVSAARAVCGEPDIRDLAGIAAARVCEQQAVANAVRDVHNPRLSAIYSAHPARG